MIDHLVSNIFLKTKRRNQSSEQAQEYNLIRSK